MALSIRGKARVPDGMKYSDEVLKGNPQSVVFEAKDGLDFTTETVCL